MRWKDSGINYASGTIKVVGVDAFICIYNNGSEVCDRNHKLNTIGICSSQSLGKSNSTDGASQPTYSVCTADYNSLGNSQHINNVSSQVEGLQKVLSDTTVSGLSHTLLCSRVLEKSDMVYIKPISVDNFCYPFVMSDSINDSVHVNHGPIVIESLFKVLQRDSGYVSRAGGAHSDLFEFDTFARVAILHPYFYALKKQSEAKISKVQLNYGIGHVLSSGVENSSPWVGGENPAEICVGDQTAPTLENAIPAVNSVLVNSSEKVSFDIVDAIGGVKLSSLYVTISGNVTSQAGGFSIVEAGVVQVPSYASIVGTQTRYSFEYDPPSSWQPNEQVYVTITGSDNKPLDEDDEEFVCYGDTNTFYDSWKYKVENIEDFSASITAVADTGAPYLDSVLPVPYLGYTADTSDISFYIKDDLSGVDIDTVNIYINDAQVIRNGVSLSSAASITGSSSSYYFLYSPPGSFSYGTRVVVRVVADDLYAILPNSLDTAYYFDVVSDSTVSFENFIPEVGITWNPEVLDVEVNVIDRVYDIDVSDLYLSINGDLCSSTVTPIYGNRELTTTVSGVDYICGTVLNNTDILVSTVAGVTLSGFNIYGGSISSGELSTGWMSAFPSPFSATPISSTISGIVFDGIIVSGTVDTVLVSGVNWDGSYVNSTITGVDLSSVYASSVCTSGTVISGTIGRHLSYHPTNDFNFSGAINVLVHGTNNSIVSPVTRETVYQLLHGYNIKSFNRAFKHDSKVNVFVGVDNEEDFSNNLSYGFYFETIEQQSNDMTANITGIAPWEDLSASIEPQAPVHKFGKTMEVVLYAEDFEGNALGPFTYYYTIEEN